MDSGAVKNVPLSPVFIMDNTSHDNDVSRLFREHDNIGPDSSLWLRPLRQLFKDGKPVGQAIVLTISLTEQQRLPLGVLAQTQDNRMIFWPTLPQNAKMACAGETIDTVDHITLELPSEKIHVTGYDTSGQAIHTRRAWRLHHFAECNIALWFILMVPISILRQQDMAVQRRAKMPTTDKDRRVNELHRFISKLSFSNVSLSPCDVQYNYVCCVLCLASENFTADHLSSSLAPINSMLASEIEGWPNGNQFHAMPLKLGQQTICVAATCPHKKLSPDLGVSVAFPQSGGSKQQTIT